MLEFINGFSQGEHLKEENKFKFDHALEILEIVGKPFKTNNNLTNNKN